MTDNIRGITIRAVRTREDMHGKVLPRQVSDDIAPYIKRHPERHECFHRGSERPRIVQCTALHRAIFIRMLFTLAPSPK